MPTTTTGIATEFIQFTRASNATVTDSDGRVKWAPHNLLTNSESFDAAAWAKENTTVDTNVASAPNGTSTAELLKNTTAAGVHGSYFTLAGLDASNGLRLSCFVKKNTVRYVALGMWNASGTAECGAGFDLDTGTGVAGAVGAGYSASNASITSVGSSWYLISVTVVTPVTSNYATIINRSTSYSSGRISEVYTGATSESTYIWGASLYRSDLGGMQANTSAYPLYNPTTPKNLLGYTEDLTAAAYWTNIDTADVTTGITNPRGLSGATLVYPTSSGADRIIYRASIVGGPVSTPYTLSVYAKANGINFLYFGTFGGGTGTPSLCAFFDLQNGTKTQTGSYFTSASITPVGDGWYRCTATANATLAGVYPIFGLANANNSNTVTASGTSGIYLWGAQLSDSASLDPYVPNYGAAVTSAAYYGPRRDFDPVTLACKGLLVEEQRTNLQLNSNVFGTSTFAATVVAGAAASPSGLIDASSLACTSVGGRAILSTSVTSGIVYTFSVFIKSGTNTSAFIELAGTAGSGGAVVFNLSSGTVTSGTGGAIVPAPNGFYRCSVTSTATGTGASDMRIGTGDATSKTVFVYGAQLEANASFATSYIPTTTASATRNADVAQVSTAAFPYSATEGTLVVSGSPVINQNISAYFVQLASDVAGTNYGSSNAIFKGATSGLGVGQKVKGMTVTDANSFVSEVATTGDINTDVIKASYAFAANNFGLSVNGSAVIPDTSGAMPSASTVLSIGAMRGGIAGYFMSGHIRQITYLPRRISNADLVTRST